MSAIDITHSVGPLGNWRLWTARALSVVHGAVVALFLVGWALPWRGALWAVAIGAIVVRTNWWLFDDRCLLTILESRLRGGDALAARRLEEDADAPPSFIGDLVARVLGRPLPLQWVDNASHAIMWGAFSVATLRLADVW